MSQMPHNSLATSESPEELARSATSFLFRLLVNMAEARNTTVEKVSVIINKRTSVVTVIGATRADVEIIMGSVEGHPPAKNESIDNFPRVEIVDLCMECAICLVKFVSGSTIVKEMPCKHQFCEECIIKWLRIRGLCPVCRFCMPDEEIQMQGQEMQLGSWKVRLVVLTGVHGRVAADNEVIDDVADGEIESLNRDIENIR